MKKVIYFDFFGVISSPAMPPFCKKHGLKKEEYAPLLHDLDNGDKDIDEVLKILETKTNIPYLTIKEELLDNIKIDEELLSLIIRLKKKYKVCLLSNSSLSFIGLILKKYDLYPYFDKVYISSTLKMIKPNKDIFEYALLDQGIKADSAIFIDDNEENTLGAKKSGIDALIYSTYSNLVNDLTNKNIL